MDDVAPVEAVSEAPAAEPTEKPVAEAKAPPKPRTIDDDLEDVLKKHGGLKYKAGGKEKSITAAKDLTRYLSRVDGTEAAQAEALKSRQEGEGIKAKLAGIAKLPPRERLGAMQAAGIDPKLIREAVEESILLEDEQAKSQAHLTPRERELQAALDEKSKRLSEYEKGQADYEAEQEQFAESERIGKLGKSMGDAAGRALMKAQISPKHVNHFLPSIAARLDRSAALGLDLDEDEIAESVMAEHGTLADQFYGGLELDALSERLAGIEVEIDDPRRPGQKMKTTKLKALMAAEAAKIRARQNAPQPIARTQERQQQRGGDSASTLAEKMAAARTFGGGNR